MILETVRFALVPPSPSFHVWLAARSSLVLDSKLMPRLVGSTPPFRSMPPAPKVSVNTKGFAVLVKLTEEVAPELMRMPDHEESPPNVVAPAAELPFHTARSDAVGAAVVPSSHAAASMRLLVVLLRMRSVACACWMAQNEKTNRARETGPLGFMAVDFLLERNDGLHRECVAKEQRRRKMFATGAILRHGGTKIRRLLRAQRMTRNTFFTTAASAIFGSSCLPHCHAAMATCTGYLARGGTGVSFNTPSDMIAGPDST